MTEINICIITLSRFFASDGDILSPNLLISTLLETYFKIKVAHQWLCRVICKLCSCEIGDTCMKTQYTRPYILESCLLADSLIVSSTGLEMLQWTVLWFSCIFLQNLAFFIPLFILRPPLKLHQTWLQRSSMKRLSCCNEFMLMSLAIQAWSSSVLDRSSMAICDASRYEIAWIGCSI